MVPKLDKSALASALLKKNKGKEVWPIEIISYGLDPSINVPLAVPPVAPSSVLKAPSWKRRRSLSPSRGVVQFSSSGGKGERFSDHPRR